MVTMKPDESTEEFVNRWHDDSNYQEKYDLTDEEIEEVVDMRVTHLDVSHSIIDEVYDSDTFQIREPRDNDDLEKPKNVQMAPAIDKIEDLELKKEDIGNDETDMVAIYMFPISFDNDAEDLFPLDFEDVDE